MKILLVNTTEHTGGASIACGRLQKALVAQGHEVRLVVRNDQRPVNRLRFVWERLMLLRDIPRSRVFSIDDGRCGTDITATADFEWADVVHLHWINQAMMGVGDIARLLRRCRETGKRVVWTMHDIWPATGVCHLPGTCEKWLTGCGHCPLLRHPGANDLSARTFRRKQAAYRQGNIRFVACSDYLAEAARKSPLLQGHSVTSIANPLDTDFFSPGERERTRLGLPEDKRLVLFVAYNVNDDNKGFRHVAEAVRRIKAEAPALSDSMAVVPVGKNASQWAGRLDCEVVPFEYVGDRETMRSLYRACDVLIIASHMENLPNTIVEAKACGLPVVAPRVGGIPQMIRHKVDGFLAEPYRTGPTPGNSGQNSGSSGQSSDVSGQTFDADRQASAVLEQSLADGLRFVLQHPEPAELSRQARADAVATYSEANVVKRYEALYK